MIMRELLTTAWIGPPVLPVEYHSPHLITLGNTIRKIVALDASKTRMLQLTMARICVEIYIGSQLPQVISINDCQQEVSYEILTFYYLVLSKDPFFCSLLSPAKSPLASAISTAPENSNFPFPYSANITWKEL